jgi:hypothetical protein
MANRLAGETSPYLLQHASNPVDWYPWGDEALSRAKAEARPILLSIGYAACHWCHVMERESFEDPETARIMNEGFVPVKVDREERPDLDSIYMDAVQAMTGHGGWPMTVFLTPEGVPFYGGTYFPPEDRPGLPSFRRVLGAVAEAWAQRRGEVAEQGGKLVSHISQSSRPQPSAEPLSESITRAAFEAMSRAFDARWGGFGGAPKFPQPMTIEFLLRCSGLGYPEAAGMLDLSLSKMARGGLFDQVGGGFHRYTVDGTWLVPHFEKMLYDNGQLLRLYARAWMLRGEPLFRETAIATGEYLLREMRHDSGGFFSSQDADSEGIEGKFYAWPFQELAAACGPDAPAAIAYFGVSSGGNWEGTNVLWAPRPDDEVASELGTSSENVRAAIARARARLREARSKRVPPATDDKVLSAWNGLAISGLAEAGRALDRPDFVAAAVAAADFVLGEMRDRGGRLLRSWRDGRPGAPGYLDDYASMCAACLDLYETTFEERFFAEARALAEEAIRLFDDPDGGFFDTGADAEALVLRPKDLFDNAVPSGNATMAGALLRLAALTGEHSYETKAASVLRLLHHAMSSSPLGFGHALGVLYAYLRRAKEVAIVGDPSGEATRRLARIVWERPALNWVMAVGPPGPTRVPLLEGRTQVDSAPTAYVCENFACKLPVTDPDALAGLLSA